MAIQSFLDRNIEEFFTKGKIGKGVGWASCFKVAQRKLDIIHYANFLEELKSPPRNRLEALKGYHSIRINDQWRIVFSWTVNGPGKVMIIDYHK